MLPKTEINESQKPTDAILEESAAKSGMPGIDLPINSITTETSPASPTLLAWSSSVNNKISIVELKTKQEFAEFNGVKLNTFNVGYQSWTLVKEIASTGLLVSIHHSQNRSANLEVFDVSQKGQVKKIYSFEEVTGANGEGDVVYNPRRRILGAIPVGGRISYHLFNFATSKTGNIVKLIRKSRWHSQNPSRTDNCISGVDFNPNGEVVATIDHYGTCLISDISTNHYRLHLNLGLGTRDFGGRCRWSTNPDEPLLFVKHDMRLLNTLDIEKKVLTLKSPIELESHYCTFWIEVCPNNGNLLASAGMDDNVKIFDKRESKIVQIFGGIHRNVITCVRWSPGGDMLASASHDRTAALLDFKTGKKLYTGQSSDENAVTSVCFL